MKPVVEEIEGLVARVGTDPVYGYSHCLRVYSLAEDLAASEDITYDREILRVAALLHDVGLYKAYAMREPADHAKRSALVARRILQDWDFPPQASPAAPSPRPSSSKTPSASTTSAPSASPACSPWSAPKRTSPTSRRPSGTRRP